MIFSTPTPNMSSLPKWADILSQKYIDKSNEESNYSEKLGLEMRKLFDSSNGINKKSVASNNVIPTFYTNENIDLKHNEALIAVIEIARELFLDNVEERLLSEHDLDVLFSEMVSIIKRNSSIATDMNDNNTNNLNCFLDYEIFRELKQVLPSLTNKFFTASIFRKFPLNKYGQLNGISFHQFVSLSVNLLHQFITLSRYDISSNIVNTNISNYNVSDLTESDLELFISDQIEMIPSLMKYNSAFHPYYTYHAVRKFMFCLCSSSSNNAIQKEIPITKILCSNTFCEFNEFRFFKHEQNENNRRNWFYVEDALRVYKMYLSLDQDHNGTLSQKEMLQFNGSSISNLCIQRIFQYKKTWDGELDYKGFLNFVLAVEYKHLPQSLNYFWDIIDLDGDGYLTPLTIHTLFRSVQKKMGIFGLEPVNSEDVLSEIIDMVHPKNKQKITKHDLIKSKMFGTVVSILTDVKGFWEYDNRESLRQQDGQGQ